MKTDFPRMFKYMIPSNVSMFTSLLSGLNVSGNKTENLFFQLSLKQEQSHLK